MPVRERAGLVREVKVRRGARVVGRIDSAAGRVGDGEGSNSSFFSGPILVSKRDG